MKQGVYMEELTFLFTYWSRSCEGQMKSHGVPIYYTSLNDVMGK
uniref:Uncharacterized protein n=1 Tax=Lepeophtheirus salmonis TaxID=72036 RepID=A0A0K2TGB8_LEPSM